MDPAPGQNGHAEPADAPAEAAPPQRPSSWRAALAGLLAAGTSLAVAELVTGTSRRFTSPMISVGNRFVERTPNWLKDFAIERFGTNDKVALLVGIAVVAALLGLTLGLLGARRFAVGAGGIAAFGVVGIWAASQEPGAAWWTGLPSAIGAVAGIAALGLLLTTLPGAASPKAAAPVVQALGLGQAPGLSRRAFLAAGTGVAALAVAATAAGRRLQGRFSAAGSRLAVVLPRPARPAPPVADGVVVAQDGLVPYLTPNDDFYRIDVNLTVPQIPTEGWSLRITGLVDREVELSYDDLLDMELVEERITLTCVSNEIGGKLVGNATWLGVPLHDLLDRAGVQPEADQIVGRAFDGFTTGFPVQTLDDGRPAMVALGMNGEPLPLVHGFPARLVVPGLYGYVSATKWLTEIELTTFADFDQYWVRKQWSAEGPIKTMSRIDTPKGLSRLDPGPVIVGGVAWAQTRGIERVEVRVDDGPWQEAVLARADNVNTWVQWTWRWDAPPGRHTLAVRATDGTGRTQTEERTRPFPNGASGWHDTVVIVGGS